MIKRFFVVSSVLLFISLLSSCKPGTSSENSFSSDPASIAKGEEAFNLNCSGCHNFTQDGIGPQLGGLTKKVPASWIKLFIQDPQQLINAGDERALQLSGKYKAGMPAFKGLQEEQINNIIAFIHAHAPVDRQMANENRQALLNPIPKTIEVSKLVVGLQLITQIPSSAENGQPPLTRITKIGNQPNSDNLFVLDLRGKLYRLQHGKPIVYMDLQKLKPKFIQEPGLATGFGSFAFHPAFAKNGLLYTTHTEAPGSGKPDFGYADSVKVALQWVLTEWKADIPGAATFSGTSRELMRINMVSGIHGVQEIAFNPFAKKNDEEYGLLYVSVGDGGSVENGFPFLAHSREKIWGTIVRIDPSGKNSANGKYGIPPNNPFVHDQSGNLLGEIYAYGFRNPHRFTWISHDKMIACNIGQANIESLDLVLPGHDYGWPIREGNFVLNPYGDLTKVYPLPPNDSMYGVTYPVAEYDHDEGKAISGGFVYSMNHIPQLKDKFLFGDIPTGRLFYIEMAGLKSGKQAEIREWKISLNNAVKTLKELCGSGRVDLHFGKDANGEVYILTKADGKIYKLVNAKIADEK